MSTKVLKVVLVLLLVCMVSFMAACEKEREIDRKDDKKIEAIDVDDFKDIMEDFDYEVVNGADVAPEGVDTFWVAYSSRDDDRISASHLVFDDKSAAIDYINSFIDTVNNAKEDGSFEGSIEVSGSDNFKKCVVKGSFDDNELFEGDWYMVDIRVDIIVISSASTRTDKDHIKEVDKIIKKLGY